MRKNALASAKEANDQSFRWENSFHDCMTDYIIKNVKVPLSPSVSASEFAEAALSQCQEPLNSYAEYRKLYHLEISSASVYGTNFDIGKVIERSDYKARLDRQELTEQGKRLAISKTIELSNLRNISH